jgi:hypothetical protein
MDKLEKYIRDNRENLDKYLPHENVWRRIENELKVRKTIIPTWFSVAAAVILFLGISGILYLSFRQKDNNNPGRDTQQTALKETEAYYNSLVISLYREARPLLTSQTELATELNSDMAQLDSICADIKKDLKDNVANQEVIEALIQNYRIKLQILEDMLGMLKQNENKKDKPDSHEL